MNRLSVRLVLSHLLVALLGALATFVIVRQLAPALFDETLRRAQAGGPRGPGQGMGQSTGLREQFATAVDQALLIGALVGAGVAAIFGILAAWRLIRPLGRLRTATHRIADGHYDTAVAVPKEAELADLANDVNSLGRTLAETEARRLRLLGEVAHEMRTPLTVIDGYVEGMIDNVLPTDTASLGQVGEESRRLRRLADDLSALSRAEEGRLQLAPARVDVRQVVASAAERLRPQVHDAGLSLSVDCGPVALTVDADADRLSQVVTNLVGNAIRATPVDGSVSVTCAARGSWVEIAVADTGEGLAAEDLNRVFERFYRVRGRTSIATDSGTGIGLTISRGIIRAHGGELTAASAGLGNGAVFTARIPVAGA
ncbi:MAG: HAMP domain-containing histidine kinase [Propionibacteriaceae bacterium]|nr:HAMP domain-containing histidine kinase [Propionibacteriaceae bacterium]